MSNSNLYEVRCRRCKRVSTVCARIKPVTVTFTPAGANLVLDLIFNARESLTGGQNEQIGRQRNGNTRSVAHLAAVTESYQGQHDWGYNRHCSRLV